MATATNDNQVQSAVPTGLWGTITHLSVHKSATGGHHVRRVYPADHEPHAGRRPAFAVRGRRDRRGDQRSGHGRGVRIAYGAETALEGIFDSGTLYVGLHTGAPGTAGTANEVSGNGYARISVGNADWTVS